MITEKEIVDDLQNVSNKLALLVENRRNNAEFWDDVNTKIKDILNKLNIDKRIYGW